MAALGVLMPQRQKILVPATEGLRQDVDARLAAVKWTALENVQVDAKGAFVKRAGFVTVDNQYEGSGNALSGVRTMLSTGREVLAVDQNDLWAYDDTNDEWRWRGPVGPGTLNVETLSREVGSVSIVEAARAGDEVVAFFRRYYQSGDPSSPTYNTRGVGLVRHIDGHHLSSSRWPGAANPIGYQAHVVANDTAALFLWADNSAPRDIDYFYRPNGVTTTNLDLTGGGTLISNDLDALGPNFGIASQWRGYDVARINSSQEFVLAYLRSSSTVCRFYQYSIASTPLASQGPFDVSAATYSYSSWSRVAIVDDPSLDRIWVALVGDPAEGGDELVVFGLARSTMAVMWGPTVVDTAGSGRGFTNLGVSRGTVNGGGNEIAVTWTEADVTSGDDPVAKCALVDTGGLRVSGILERYNMWTTTKPFWVGAKTFCGTRTRLTHGNVPYGIDAGTAFSADAVQSNIFEADCIMRWDTNVHTEAEYWNTDDAWLAGVYNVGYAATEPNYDLGNGQNVHESSGVYLWANLSTSTSLRSYETQRMADLVTLDTTEAPLGIAVGEDGAAVIGGSVVTWYDGVRSFELGHVCQPLIEDVALSAVGGGSTTLTDTQTYYYTAVWYYYDATGTVHRSAPSYIASEQFTAGGGSNYSFDVSFRTNPATSKNNPKSGVIVYRAINDIQTRIIQPGFLLENLFDSAWATAAWSDYDQVSAENALETLYTAGGEIEAIAPEGARIPLVSGGRLWLGDMARRERVQYSKPFAPGTASELALAPEFNEGFGYVLSSGERVMGLASLDDKTVILTDRAIYTNVGDGPVDDGSQNNFSGPRRINSDSGCVEPRSVAVFPDGVLFQSAAGIYLLDRGLGVSFIGEPVQDVLESFPTVTSAVVVPEDSQVRFSVVNAANDDGRIVVYDYSAKLWFTWELNCNGDASNTAIQAACYHQPSPGTRGTYYAVDQTGKMWKQDTSVYEDAGNAYTMKCQSGWVQSANHGGWQRIQNVVAMCADEGFQAATLGVCVDFDDGSLLEHQWSNLAWSASPNADGTVTLPPGFTYTCATSDTTAQTSATTLKTGFAANAPRGYSRDGTTWWLLLEPGASNLVSNFDPTGAGWTYTGIGNTVASTTGPDGGATTGYGVPADATAVLDLAYLSNHFPAGLADHTLSSWVWDVDGTNNGTVIKTREAGVSDMAPINRLGFVADTDWVHESATYEGAARGTASELYLYGNYSSTGVGTVRYAFWQVEERLYATSWVDGTRATGSLGIEPELLLANGYFDFSWSFMPLYDWDQAQSTTYWMHVDANTLVRYYGGRVELVAGGVTVATAPWLFQAFETITVRVQHLPTGVTLTVTGSVTGTTTVSSSSVGSLIDGANPFYFHGQAGLGIDDAVGFGSITNHLSPSMPASPDVPLFMKLRNQKNYAVRFTLDDGGTRDAGLKFSGFYLEAIVKAGPAKLPPDHRS